MATVLEEAALKLAAARSAVMAVALADAEQYRLDRSAWRFCEDQSAGRDVPPPRPASDLSRLGQERTMTINLTTTARRPGVDADVLAFPVVTLADLDAATAATAAAIADPSATPADIERAAAAEETAFILYRHQHGARPGPEAGYVPPPDGTDACTCDDPGCPDPVHQSRGGAA